MQDTFRQQQSPASATLSRGQQRYTVFIRLPFPRNGFVDPPVVQWDAVKDKALWKIISKASNTGDLDWQDIAARFDVSLEFLMQHAAWLYERHFSGVRRQMQRLASTSSPMPNVSSRPRGSSDLPVAEVALPSEGAQTVKTTARVTSTSAEHDTASTVQEEETQDQLAKPRPSYLRTPSSATITQSRLFTSTRTVAQKSGREQLVSHRVSGLAEEDRLDASQEPGTDAGSQLAADEQGLRRSPLLRQPDLISSLSDEAGEDDAIDEEGHHSSSNEFPFAAAVRSRRELKPTRDYASSSPSRTHAARDLVTTGSSSSSAHSTAPTQSTEARSKVDRTSQRPDALSPKHRAQLAQVSQRTRTGDGSDGTPSMGSSYSDLDDAGISASAIEDAVLQAGGVSIASRVSGLSQALRRNR